MDYNINELNTKQNAFLIVFYLNIAIFKPGGLLMAHDKSKCIESAM